MARQGVTLQTTSIIIIMKIAQCHNYTEKRVSTIVDLLYEICTQLLKRGIRVKVQHKSVSSFNARLFSPTERRREISVLQVDGCLPFPASQCIRTLRQLSMGP